MSEFFKVNPNLISKHKPESVLREKPIGMVPLNKAFFEKLRASLPQEALSSFNELIKYRPKKGQERPQYRALVELIGYIKDQDVINSLTSFFLDKSDSEMKKSLAAYLSAYSDKIEHHKLYSLAPNKLMEKEEGSILPQANFKKSGSQLDLIGGTEFAKHIVRYVTRESFECWKKAFLAKKVWMNNGFEYIPIEPIMVTSDGELNIFEVENNHVAVIAGVLGKNAWDFLRNPKNKHFSQEIKLQEEKIAQILKEELHIEHGHIHQGNFCVEKIDNSIRLYLIDFDMAKEVK